MLATAPLPPLTLMAALEKEGQTQTTKEVGKSLSLVLQIDQNALSLYLSMMMQYWDVLENDQECIAYSGKDWSWMIIVKSV